MIKKDIKELRLRKMVRIRKKIIGTVERPRLSIHRSQKHIYAQLVDDTKGNIIASMSTLSKDVREEIKSVKKTMDRCRLIGEKLAQKAVEKNISSVVFDRSGYKYHGRIKAIADGARKGGLKL
jgi:large subunit ribosomal protein L18